MPNPYVDDTYLAPSMAPLQATARSAQVTGGYTPVTPSTAVGASGAGVNAPMGAGDGPGFWSAEGGAGLALGAIQTLGSLWNSFQQNKLAKQSLALQTRAFETNLANQTKSYNTALEDRINARYATEGRPDEAAAYIEKNKL